MGCNVSSQAIVGASASAPAEKGSSPSTSTPPLLAPIVTAVQASQPDQRRCCKKQKDNKANGLLPAPFLFNNSYMAVIEDMAISLGNDSDGPDVDTYKKWKKANSVSEAGEKFYSLKQYIRANEELLKKELDGGDFPSRCNCTACQYDTKKANIFGKIFGIPECCRTYWGTFYNMNVPSRLKHEELEIAVVRRMIIGMLHRRDSRYRSIQFKPCDMCCGKILDSFAQQTFYIGSRENGEFRIQAKTLEHTARFIRSKIVDYKKGWSLNDDFFGEAQNVIMEQRGIDCLEDEEFMFFFEDTKENVERDIISALKKNGVPKKSKRLFARYMRQ